MSSHSIQRLGTALVCATVAVACRRPAASPATTLDVSPAARVAPASTHAGRPFAVTYRWTTGPRYAEQRRAAHAFVHFVAEDGAILIHDDHVPQPPPDAWEPGRTYEYTRLVFTHRQFPGPLEIRVGLYDPRDGVRLGLTGDHVGGARYQVGRVVVERHRPEERPWYFSGFHPASAEPDRPFDAFRWTQREAVVACRNPAADAILFLRARTDARAFSAPPVLRLAVGAWRHAHHVADEETFTLALPVPRDALGGREWTDVTLTMDATFRPPGDSRELGLRVERLLLLRATDVTVEMQRAAAR